MASLGPPYTDVRVERPHMNWNWIDSMIGLVSIDLQPPASGPEIELTFGTSEGARPVSEELIRTEVERLTHRPVLAIRQRNLEEE